MLFSLYFSSLDRKKAIPELYIQVRRADADGVGGDSGGWWWRWRWGGGVVAASGSLSDAFSRKSGRTTVGRLAALAERDCSILSVAKVDGR